MGAVLAIESAGPRCIVPLYYRLSNPIIIVTPMRGREVFTDSRRLFARLEDLAESPPEGPMFRSIYQFPLFVSESGCDALETMLRTVGMVPFFTASRRSIGPERAALTRYNWAFLTVYLGWQWNRA